MFKIAKRDDLVWWFRTDRDVSGWTLNLANAIVFHSRAAVDQRAAHDSRTEKMLFILDASSDVDIDPIATVINGKVINAPT
jgi:hypothetical protein